VRESRKFDEARGGGASAYPTTPKFIDLFAFTHLITSNLKTALVQIFEKGREQFTAASIFRTKK